MNYSLEETPLAKIDLTKDKMSAWIEAQGKGKKVEMDVYGSPSEKSLQELENVRKLSKELQDNIQELENTVRLSDVENQAMNPTAPILDYSEDHEFVSANKLDDYYSQEDKNDAKEAEKHRLTKGMAQRTEIQEFYKDQCVFLTGGTGFLGKVLIEKLLRSCKDIDTIYVLVRPKKGKDPTTRIHEMLDEFVFERAHNENPKGIHKVVPVVGNMELPDLGLSLEDRKTLTSRVSGELCWDTSTGFITLPTDFCHITDSKVELIQRVFPDIAQKFNNHNWLGERAILAAKNKDVEDLNATIQNFLPGQLVSFKSVDTVMNQDDVINYPTEFLNSLELPGLPPHNLQLKVGSVVIMLRNINQPRLCNGTRLAVKRLMNNVIEATIIKGKYKGEDVLIPRIPMIPMDLPFDFKRLQFPVRLAFAMSINKSQGQSHKSRRQNTFPRKSQQTRCHRFDVTSGAFGNLKVRFKLNVYILQVLRTMYMDLNKVADMVPVDLCVNAIIVSAYHTAKNFKENQTSNIPIYNFVSGAQSPVTWRQFIEYNMKYGFHNPTTKAVWYYGLNPTNNYYMFLFYNFFLHYLPALLLDVFSFLTGQRRKMLKFYSKVIKLAHILFYFSTQEWCFSDHGVRSMWSSLSDRDRAVFNFNMADMSWDYMAETFLLGLRVYLVKDDLSTLPEARKRWNRLYYMHQLLKITTFSVVLYLGYLLLTGLASMILG
nr:fatty acyl-CoA reductase wat-like [Danaus plexippus plexippus]